MEASMVVTPVCEQLELYGPAAKPLVVDWHVVALVVVKRGKVAFVRALCEIPRDWSHPPGSLVPEALAAPAARARLALCAPVVRADPAVSHGPPCHLLVRKVLSSLIAATHLRSLLDDRV